MTYASAKTEDGNIHVYIGEGEMTSDPIDKEFFGCAGVAHIPQLQNKLRIIGRAGYRHHVSMTFGQYESALTEAFSTYLPYKFTQLEN